MNAPAQKIDVLDNIKLAVGALSAHDEHDRVNQLLNAYEAIKELIEADRGYDNARCGVEATTFELQETQRRRAAALANIVRSAS